MSLEFREITNDGPLFFSKIITSEMWVYSCDPETNKQTNKNSRPVEEPASMRSKEGAGFPESHKKRARRLVFFFLI